MSCFKMTGSVISTAVEGSKSLTYASGSKSRDASMVFGIGFRPEKDEGNYNNPNHDRPQKDKPFRRDYLFQCSSISFPFLRKRRLSAMSTTRKLRILVMSDCSQKKPLAQVRGRFHVLTLVHYIGNSSHPNMHFDACTLGISKVAWNHFLACHCLMFLHAVPLPMHLHVLPFLKGNIQSS